MTSYMRFELTWAYAPNVAAGEDVQIIPVPVGQWPTGVPQFDFWLFDSSTMFEAHYTSDGVWVGVVPVTSKARIVAANRFRDAAVHHAMPWRRYIDMRPELAARLPAA